MEKLKAKICRCTRQGLNLCSAFVTHSQTVVNQIFYHGLHMQTTSDGKEKLSEYCCFNGSLFFDSSLALVPFTQ